MFLKDLNRPICQAFKIYPALKPRLNCALHRECGCWSEVKKCCSKSILLFFCGSCPDIWMLPSFNKQSLHAISPSYQPVTLYGEDKSRQLKFKLPCALPWLSSFRVSSHLSPGTRLDWFSLMSEAQRKACCQGWKTCWTNTDTSHLLENLNALPQSMISVAITLLVVCWVLVLCVLLFVCLSLKE